MSFSFQNQILIGTILGGASLIKPPKGRNYYLSMRGKDEQWLKYKMEEMPQYYPASEMHLYGSTYRCNSCCLESLTDMYKLLYRDNKRFVTMGLLDQLMDIGIAVWYLDGGGKTGRNRKNAYFNVTKLGVNSNIAERYFNEVGMPCKINQDGDRLKLVFTVNGTEILFNTIEHRVPDWLTNYL